MLELGRDPHLVQKLVLTCVVVGFRDLEGDLDVLDRILRPIDIGERPGRDSTQDPVLANFLAGAQQGQFVERMRRTASFQPARAITANVLSS